MNNMQEFHHGHKPANRVAQVVIGIVFLVILAGIGVYAVRDLPARPHTAVSDNNLPSP